MIDKILPLLVIFGAGGLTMIAIAYSPIGRAIADKIRGRTGSDPHPEVVEEIERLRGEMAELQERVDFAERLLARATEREQLPGAG